MAWKIEKWISSLGPEHSGDGKEYIRQAGLESSRDVVIKGCSLLDAALAELLSLRLTGEEKLMEDFLGANEDGRAPAGSFGARIDLARLTGILGQEEVACLKTLKGIRNKFAHRVKVTLLDQPLRPMVQSVLNFSIVTKASGELDPYKEKVDEQQMEKYARIAISASIYNWNRFLMWSVTRVHRLHNLNIRYEDCG